MALDLDDARTRYRLSFSPEDHERLPFYSSLLRALEVDEVGLEVLASIAVEQRNPMLVLAALHLAALRGHPRLSPIYDAARRGALDDPLGATREVIDVLHDDPSIVLAQLHRRTQTNEPGRSAVLQAVIGAVARGRAEAINLIDVGTSAGINLYFDHFPVRRVDDGSPLSLVCDDLTPVDRTSPLPGVATRIGIDVAPLDLESDDDRLWLTACLWPEEQRRHDRFSAVVEARSTWPPSTVLTGSALDLVGDAINQGDRSLLTVVMNTWACAYFSAADQVAYFEAMSRRCLEGDVAWVSIESPLAVQWPPPSGMGRPPRKGGSQILVTLPGAAPTSWGWCHPHGHWLWLDVDSTPTPPSSS